MAGLYRCIAADVIALFNATWAHPEVPIFWRANDPNPLPDPSDVPNFLRNTVDFGPETMTAFGGGRGANLKTQHGEVQFIGFTARSNGEEDTLLDLLADAMATVRSQRIIGSYAPSSDLSFVGSGSGFDINATEDGNWFVRGARMAFEYRFNG